MSEVRAQLPGRERMIPNAPGGLLVATLALVVMSGSAFAQDSRSTMSAADIPPVVLSGRLRSGAVNYTTIADGYVFAVEPETGRVVGWSRTAGGAKPDSGAWEINELPWHGKVLLVGFHPRVKDNVAIQEVELESGSRTIDLATPQTGTPSGFLPKAIAEAIVAEGRSGEVSSLAEALLQRLPASEREDALPDDESPKDESTDASAPPDALYITNVSKDDHLKLRSSPRIAKDNVLWRLRPENTVLHPTGRSEPPWIEVEINGHIGWVHSKYVQSTKEDPSESSHAGVSATERTDQADQATHTIELPEPQSAPTFDLGDGKWTSVCPKCGETNAKRASTYTGDLRVCWNCKAFFNTGAMHNDHRESWLQPSADGYWGFTCPHCSRYWYYDTQPNFTTGSTTTCKGCTQQIFFRKSSERSEQYAKDDNRPTSTLATLQNITTILSVANEVIGRRTAHRPNPGSNSPAPTTQPRITQQRQPSRVDIFEYKRGVPINQLRRIRTEYR